MVKEFPGEQQMKNAYTQADLFGFADCATTANRSAPGGRVLLLHTIRAVAQYIGSTNEAMSSIST